ncbi:Amino acid/polyamine transporter I [Penicillium brevicompactum]|uniref:Amino acid/polyamine transporter I n=1 Tax=Penicillium brevicompactum TaxID=5074 RepID=A0A9W9UYF9_PENBR|nr:Amino acid/polyamine transporter I [Penicillium brevicompactum]
MSLINLCSPDFDVSSRWQNFLIYVGFATWAWLVNVFGIKLIPGLELLGSLSTALGFVAFSIALLVVAPKATPDSVFKTINNDTGYSSGSLSVFLGLYNSMTTLMALDGPTHLAEELPSPKRILPRILVITITSQAMLGVVWILVLGFSIHNLQAIIHTSTGVPVVELVRQATSNNAAAIIFCLILIINNGTSAVASATTVSRQGYAFARDGVLIGLVYLFSSSAFNAIVGSQAVFMISSCGSPALIMLLTGRRLLSYSPRWNLGHFAYPICVVAVGYSLLVLSVAFIPQSAPLTSLNMNYTILIVIVFLVIMTVTWLLGEEKPFDLPTKTQRATLLIAKSYPMENALSQL